MTMGVCRGMQVRGDRRRWRTSVFPRVVEDFREAIVDFPSGLDDTDTHQAIAAGQFFTRANDFVDTANRAKASLRPDEIGGDDYPDPCLDLSTV